MSSCAGPSKTTSVEDEFTPQATTSVSWELESSSTGNIGLDLSASYEYLDSLNKKFASGTLWEILAQAPYTIVYFYPKDGTPNCTIQALDFSLMREQFLEKGYQIIGVSADDATSHMNFAERNELRIALLEDIHGGLLSQFGNKWELQKYGNGDALTDIRRSTFIVDKTGKPLYAFYDVTAKGHARRIFDFITQK